jgi:hypothetical protein
MEHAMGRPSNMTEEIRRFIENNWLVDASIPDRRMARMVNERFDTGFDRTKMCRVRNSLGFKFRPRFRQQELTDEHRASRFRFCSEMGTRLGTDIFNIVFSDESRFCQAPDKTWILARRGQRSQSAVHVEEKCPLGVNVFGAIGIGFKSGLLLCSAREDAAEYRALVVGAGIVEQANSLYGVSDWIAGWCACVHCAEHDRLSQPGDADSGGGTHELTRPERDRDGRSRGIGLWGRSSARWRNSLRRSSASGTSSIRARSTAS